MIWIIPCVHTVFAHMYHTSCNYFELSQPYSSAQRVLYPVTVGPSYCKTDQESPIRGLLASNRQYFHLSRDLACCQAWPSSLCDEGKRVPVYICKSWINTWEIQHSTSVIYLDSFSIRTFGMEMENLNDFLSPGSCTPIMPWPLAFDHIQ